MKVRYVQTIKPIMLPGPGLSNKWQANGRDGFYKGLCKSIVEDDKGYLLEISGSTGNAGFYRVPWSNVEHAKVEHEPTVADNLAIEAAAQAASPLSTQLTHMESRQDDTTVATPKPQKKTKPAKA